MNRIPSTLEHAERFLESLPGTFSRRILSDATSSTLRLRVRKTLGTYMVRVKISGTMQSRKIGLLGELPLVQAREIAVALEQYGSDFRSEEDFAFVLRRAQNRYRPVPTVLEAFEEVMSQRIERKRVKKKTVRNNRSALRAAGSDLYERPMDSVDLEMLRKAARQVHARCGSETFRRFSGACFWIWEYALDQGIAGIETNIAAGLKHLKIREEEKEACTRDALTWEQVEIFWRWLSDIRCPLAPVEVRLYKTMLLTGERIDSLCKAEWAEMGEDAWWIIPPEKRKHQIKRLQRAQPLFIYLTEILREVLGDPDGNSPYVFPSKRDPRKPYPASSLPLWALFRARDYVWINTGKQDWVSPKHAELVEKYLELRYTTFPLPDDFPRCCHHELGRHTLSTLAQEEGIPGHFVSMMLGHVDARKLPGEPSVSQKMASCSRLPHALLRTASASHGLSRVTRRFYSHLAPQFPAIKAAWITWSEVFCREVLGKVPECLAAEADGLRGTEDKILDLLTKRFGSIEAALQAVIKTRCDLNQNRVRNSSR